MRRRYGIMYFNVCWASSLDANLNNVHVLFLMHLCTRNHKFVIAGNYRRGGDQRRRFPRIFCWPVWILPSLPPLLSFKFGSHWRWCRWTLKWILSLLSIVHMPKEPRINHHSFTPQERRYSLNPNLIIPRNFICRQVFVFTNCWMLCSTLCNIFVHHSSSYLLWQCWATRQHQKRGGCAKSNKPPTRRRIVTAIQASQCHSVQPVVTLCDTPIHVEVAAL